MEVDGVDLDEDGLTLGKLSLDLRKAVEHSLYGFHRVGTYCANGNAR